MKKYGYLIFILPVFLFYQNCGQSGEVTLQSQLDKAVKAIPADEATPPTDDSQSTMPQAPSSQFITPALEVKATPSIVKEQGSSIIEVKYQNLNKISYTCLDRANSQSYANSFKTIKDNALSGSFSFNVANITSDVYCEFIGENSSIATLLPIKATLTIQLDCLNKIKNDNGRCEDFKCQQVEVLGLQDLSNIPARTSAGICYAVKLMSGISNSSSSLNKELDMEVVSRNHDNGYSNPSNTRNPYILNTFKGEVKILGERVIKLAGGADSNKNILVDNFILTGVYPVSNNESASQLVSHYKIRGTSDSTIKDAAGNLGVAFRNNLLPVIPFGNAGTSSVAPIDISAEIIPNIQHVIDIRALDCGGSRELSDIYLLFQ